MPQTSSAEPSTASSGYSDSKLAAADIDQYYSLLFAPTAERQPLTALYAWWQELREIPIECSDPEVARTKLAWWHEEMHRLYAGQPRHPAAVALRDAIVEYQLPAALFFDIIEAFARHAVTEPYVDEAAIREHARQTRGVLERLAARVANGSEDLTVERIGTLLELARLLRDTGVVAQRGRHYFSAEALRRFEVSASDILHGRPTTALKKLIASRAEQIQEELREARNAVPTSTRSNLASLLAESALAQTLLDRIRDDPAIVLREQPRLSALRRLWIAWRTARRARRWSPHA
nr:hypothetical protein [uncultured bacterium]